MKAIIGVVLLATCALGNLFDNVEVVKTQQTAWNPLIMTETSGMKRSGEWNVLSLQEVIQHPLFQVYAQLPLFRQHFAHPLFQVYLATPQFQQFWTHPLFPTFFTNTALFYKYIYPVVYTTNTNTQANIFNPINTQASIFNPINTWINKAYTPAINYDDIIKQVLVGGTEEATKVNMQGMDWEKLINNVNNINAINKPEEVTEIKTQVKIPIPTLPIINQLNKVLMEKVEETPMENLIVKDALIKDNLKKFYLEKMMKSVYPMSRFNKMTPEDFLIQQKLETLALPRNTNYVQVPTFNAYKNVKALPFFNYNIPTTQQVYYTNPSISPYSQMETVGTPYTFTKTVGTPYAYANTVGKTPFTFGNTALNYNTPLNYNTALNMPFNVYPTQAV